MNPLDIVSAFLLYKVLKRHIPKEHVDFVDFVHKMIDNMIATDSGEDYVLAVAIMNKTDIDTVVSCYADNSQGLLSVFVDGLILNQFFSLAKYCEMVISYAR